jgi:HPr kinase/phosphorylase
MKVTVKDLVSTERVLAGAAGMGRAVRSPQVTRPELSQWATSRDLGGSMVHLRPSLAARLCRLAPGERARLCRALMRKRPAGVVISGGTACRELLDAAEAAHIPVLRSGNVPRMEHLLAARLTPRTGLHGVLVQLFGLGVLIIGESAIGKSEAALDLVLRGHKLVADDMVLLERVGRAVIGRPADLGADLLEIRGLGVINVRVLYGGNATSPFSPIGLVVELEEWQKGVQYSLLGLREQRHRILDVSLPYLRLPVKSGRTMATLIEVAARNHILKQRGIFAARELNRNLSRRLSR